MTVQTAIAFAAFLLEDDHVLSLNERLLNFTHYFCTLNGGRANCNGTVGIHEEDLAEFYCIALVLLVAEIVNKQFLASCP